MIGVNTMIRTFVVEDDPMLAQIVAKFVEKVDGFVVIGIAHNCEEAVNGITSRNPDLVLLDVYLDGSGLDVLKEIRRTDLEIDVIMVTAAQDVQTVASSMRFGTVDYIVKPFEFARLKAALKNYESMRERLGRTPTVGQVDLDNLKTVARVPSETRKLPKNLDPLTLASVMEKVTPLSRTLTALEIANQVGISYGTAKRYLNYLVQQGQVERRLKYSVRGRPVTCYSLRSRLKS